MRVLQVAGIGRKEGEAFTLKDISFTQHSFQKIAIAGATGSGKTTLLKIIAGLVQPSAGDVFFEGQRIEGPEEKLLPGHPAIAYLSQHFELRNHYRVEEILQMACQLPEAEATLVYEVCRIDHLLKRWTHQLSGGEKQRISLARLLVSAPRFLLLDEPYSNLDVLHKNLLKEVVEEISSKLKITCLIVSHDPVDVLPWADEILVLQEGRVVQKGTLRVIYKEPGSEYVAGLFGKYNVLSPALAKAFSAFTDIEMSRIGSFIRPEDFSITTSGRGVKGEVRKVFFLGSSYEVEVGINGQIIIVSSSQNSFQKGGAVYVSLAEPQEEG